MDDKYKERIIKGLFILAEITGKELSAEIAKIYADKISRISQETLVPVLNECISSESHFPTIARIFELCGVPSKKSLAESEMNSIISQIMTAAQKGYQNVKEEDLSPIAWQVAREYGSFYKVCYDADNYLQKNLQNTAKEIIRRRDEKKQIEKVPSESRGLQSANHVLKLMTGL